VRDTWARIVVWVSTILYYLGVLVYFFLSTAAPRQKEVNYLEAAKLDFTRGCTQHLKLAQQVNGRISYTAQRKGMQSQEKRAELIIANAIELARARTICITAVRSGRTSKVMADFKEGSIVMLAEPGRAQCARRER
jgi:hypothetical protein